MLAPAELVGRVAASLRSLRRSRELSQQDLAALAGVTASAISQAERAERGLSLATLVRLSCGARRHDRRAAARRGARASTGSAAAPRTRSAASSARSRCSAARDAELRVDLVHLDVREAGAPAGRDRGTGIVAVAAGLVNVQVAGRTPAVRFGEVLVADSERVEGWRNLGADRGGAVLDRRPGRRSRGTARRGRCEPRAEVGAGWVPRRGAGRRRPVEPDVAVERASPAKRCGRPPCASR